MDRSSVMIGIDMAKEGSERTIIMASFKQISDAFNQWLTDYTSSPDGWAEPEAQNVQHGDRCADKLIEYIKAQK